MNNRGQIALVLAIIFGIVIVIGSIVIMSNSSITGNVPQENCRQVETPYEEQEEYYESVLTSDKECEYRNYDSKGGYLFEDYQTGKEEKFEWLIYGLFMISNGEEVPNLDTVQKYYISNYEEKSGLFGIKINYVNEDNNYLESFVYNTLQVGPKETETGYVSYSALWQNKPGQAKGFYLSLDKPTYEECEPTTGYQDVLRTRTVTKYKTETICE